MKPIEKAKEITKANQTANMCWYIRTDIEVDGIIFTCSHSIMSFYKIRFFEFCTNEDWAVCPLNPNRKE